MTEWEQIKKEYREVPIPKDGPHQILLSIADAKRKRARWKHLAKYGSVVAAAMLVIFILPGVFLFSAGGGESADMAAPESAIDWEAKAENSGSSVSSESDEIKYSMNFSTAADGTVSVKTPAKEQTTKEQGVCAEASELLREAISKEILRQMEERMLKDGELYYRKGELYPDGFELIAKEQAYYINEDGLYVIVFEAGEVAPKEQGVVEFVIPPEVALP